MCNFCWTPEKLIIWLRWKIRDRWDKAHICISLTALSLLVILYWRLTLWLSTEICTVIFNWNCDNAGRLIRKFSQSTVDFFLMRHDAVMHTYIHHGSMIQKPSDSFPRCALFTSCEHVSKIFGFPRCALVFRGASKCTVGDHGGPRIRGMIIGGGMTEWLAGGWKWKGLHFSDRKGGNCHPFHL